MKFLTTLASFSFALLVPFCLYQGVMSGYVVEGMFFAYVCLLFSLVAMMKREIRAHSNMQKS